jgi:hypothetical protein
MSDPCNDSSTSVDKSDDVVVYATRTGYPPDDIAEQLANVLDMVVEQMQHSINTIQFHFQQGRCVQPVLPTLTLFIKNSAGKWKPVSYKSSTYMESFNECLRVRKENEEIVVEKPSHFVRF